MYANLLQLISKSYRAKLPITKIQLSSRSAIGENTMDQSGYLNVNEELLTQLRSLPVLQLFDDHDLKNILELSRIVKYEQGELIIEEGCYDNWIYCLISGSVRIAKQGKEIKVLRRRGDVFGEMSVIDGSSRSASAYAIDDTVCLATDASYIDRLSGNDRLTFYCVMYRIFTEILAERLRDTTNELIRVREELDRLQQ